MESRALWSWRRHLPTEALFFLEFILGPGEGPLSSPVALNHVWQSEASHLLQVIGSLCSSAGPKHCMQGRTQELSRAPSWLHLSLENEDIKC